MKTEKPTQYSKVKRTYPANQQDSVEVIKTAFEGLKNIYGKEA